MSTVQIELAPPAMKLDGCNISSIYDPEVSESFSRSYDFNTVKTSTPLTTNQLYETRNVSRFDKSRSNANLGRKFNQHSVNLNDADVDEWKSQDLPTRDVVLRREDFKSLPISLVKHSVAGNGPREDERSVLLIETARDAATRLLPGDQLLKIDDQSVDSSDCTAALRLVAEKFNDNGSVKLTVRPLRELSELSVRTGFSGGTINVFEHSAETGSLSRTASLRHADTDDNSDDKVLLMTYFYYGASFSITS